MEIYKLSKNIDKNKSSEVRIGLPKRKYGLCYKRKISAKASLCKAKGEFGALLRQERLVGPHLPFTGRWPKRMASFVQVAKSQEAHKSP